MPSTVRKLSKFRPEKTPYLRSVIVSVRKKDGSMRLCVDYRELNGKIVLNIVPIPKVSDILDHIGGQLYFTTLGITKADHEKLYGDAI